MPQDEIVERWNEFAPPNAQDLTRRLESEGYCVSKWTLERGQYRSASSYAEDHSHWILTGELRVEVGDHGESYTLRPGDRDFLPGNTEYSIAPLGDLTVVYLIGARMPIPIERWSEPTPPDARELRTRLESEGYSVYEWNLERGHQSPRTIDEDESLWVLSGELSVLVGEFGYFTLRAGDRVVVPAPTFLNTMGLSDVPVFFLDAVREKAQPDLKAQPYLGEIKIFAGASAPEGWALCNGQMLPISQNQQLFSLVGTAYGGDGRITFAIPDLRGRAPMHYGRGRSVGDKGSVGFTKVGFDYSDWSRCRTATGYLALNYIISLSGVFPSADETNPKVVPLLGEGRLFAFNFAPHGWASCDGQRLALGTVKASELALGKIKPSENAGLFSLLGTTYDRDDETKTDSNGWPPVVLPNLRGLIPLHDPSALGNQVGQEDGISRESFVGLKGVVNFLVVNFCIALEGDFPQRDIFASEHYSKAVDPPFLAEVRIFFGDFAPYGWAFCNGQLLNICQNTDLFSLIGSTYGGDGEVTFALPDLRGRVPFQAGGLRTYAETDQGFCGAGEKGGGGYVGRTRDQADLTAEAERALEAVVTNLSSAKEKCEASQELSAQYRKDAVRQIDQKMIKVDGPQFMAVNFIIALAGISPVLSEIAEP